MSVSHGSSTSLAVRSRFTRSPWTGGPGSLLFLPHFFPTVDHRWLSRQMRPVLRLHIIKLTAWTPPGEEP